MHTWQKTCLALSITDMILHYAVYFYQSHRYKHKCWLEFLKNYSYIMWSSAIITIADFSYRSRKYFNRTLFQLIHF
jgi:predicted membrane protein